MDSNKLLGELLMVSGSLHDIAEKTKDDTVKKQITVVQERLEIICSTHFPITMLEIKSEKK